MQPVGILGLGAYAPQRVMTNADWSRYVDTSDEWIQARTGIKRRRIVAQGESTLDIAQIAARRALEQAGIEPCQVDEIIVATDSPEVRVPDTAALLQHRLGVGLVPTYDLGGSGCAGFVQALDIACSRVRGGRGRILVVGAEVLSRLMDWEVRETCVLFGDAAGAAVIGEVERGAILAVVAGTDGSRADILGIEVGGTRTPVDLEQVRKKRHLCITMKGQEVFKEAVTRMSQAAREVVDRAGVSLRDVTHLVPHQANLRIIKAVARSLALPLERVIVNVDEYGNTGSASVPLALAEAVSQGRVKPGDLVLLTSFGAGFHWAAALVQF